MPQADLKYSADMKIDAPVILAAIERIIKDFDDAAGACKGRAIKVAEFHHTHIFVTLALLDKPHRDRAFRDDLARKLEAAIKQHLHQPCAFSLALTFLPETYITNAHSP